MSGPTGHGDPPFVVVRDFFGPSMIDRLLDYAGAQWQSGRPAGVGFGSERRVDFAVRNSWKLGTLGDLRQTFESRILGIRALLWERLGVPPFEPSHLETELVAHGDGAFYLPHVDTRFATDQVQVRAITVVYYFHRTPKMFSGGDLRIFAVRTPNKYVEVAPDRDLLIAFPSFVPHEVMRVTSASQDPKDSRFAINCWLHKPVRNALPG
jgi:hypothetical protein